MEGDEAARVANQETLRTGRSDVPAAPAPGALALGLRQPENLADIGPTRSRTGSVEVAQRGYRSRFGHRALQRRAIAEEAVSAAEANRRFSLLLRGVREGHSYVVTSHGKPVARLIPAGRRGETAKRARRTLLSRLEAQPVMNAQRWTRYEDDP